MSNKVKRNGHRQITPVELKDVLASAEVVPLTDGPPTLEVDVNPDVERLIGNQVVELMKMRQACNKLLERALKAEGERDAAVLERDALRSRVEVLSAG